MIPSRVFKVLFKAKKYNNNPLPIATGQSILMEFRFTRIGLTTAAIPNTSVRLQIFDPTTLPMAMSGLPIIADLMLINNSGAEVPNATMVSPTTRGDRCAFNATLFAPFTKKLPAATNKIKLPINTARLMIIS